jgi:NAD(P)-dependent dehydrogenase (short-subunit alcohol dehydrogenase family)
MNLPMKKTIIVTGANTGIGAACALQLAGPETHLLLACRSEDKAKPVVEAVEAAGAKATFVELDLSDLAQVARAARRVAETEPNIDLLVNNAGVAGMRGLTRDGFELAFGVNHLGHFAFTRPLLPALDRARGRIVNVSSGNHFRARGIDFERLRGATRSYTGLPEYGVSKLCNVLFTAELRRRYPNITSTSMNPGTIRSDIWQRRMPAPLLAVFTRVVPMETVEVGGARLVHAATCPDAPLYLDRLAARDANPLALREDLAKELWAFSERHAA